MSHRERATVCAFFCVLCCAAFGFSNTNTEEPSSRFVGYDCAKNEFVSLAAGYTKVMGGLGPRPAVPYGYGSGIVFDAKRHLLWGVDTAGYVTVMRFDRGKSDLKALEAASSTAK